MLAVLLFYLFFFIIIIIFFCTTKVKVSEYWRKYGSGSTVPDKTQFSTGKFWGLFYVSMKAYIVGTHFSARNWQLPFLNQRKGENDRRKYFMINLHERMLPTSAGVEPATSWSPVGRRIQLSHRGRPFLSGDMGRLSYELELNFYQSYQTSGNIWVFPWRAGNTRNFPCRRYVYTEIRVVWHISPSWLFGIKKQHVWKTLFLIF